MEKKIKICMIIMFIMMTTTISVGAATLINSKEVVYDNKKSGIEATTVQEAVDELYGVATDYSTLNNKINNIETTIINKIYPKGSIYMSTEDDTVAKVEAKFGGTWQRYAEGRTLIGVGTGTDSNGTAKVFNKNESAGEYSHTLSIDELASHRHLEQIYSTETGLRGIAGAYNCDSKTNKVIESNIKISNYNGCEDEKFMTSNTGGSQSHNNIQPYITVYMYKRVN